MKRGMRMKEKEIKVLKVKPHKHPEEKYIGSNAESGGRIYWNRGNRWILLNDDGNFDWLES